MPMVDKFLFINHLQNFTVPYKRTVSDTNKGKAGEREMTSLKKIAAVSVLGLGLVVFGATDASAQNRNKIIKQQNKIIKQQNKIIRQEQRAEARRMRVNRGGRWYNVDQRQTDLLRQAVNEGYRQGFAAGRSDRNRRLGSRWQNSSIYRSGTVGYRAYVDRGLYQHYFQQGFQRGYEDGFNSRFRYGSINNGSVSILGAILNQVLNLQNY
jgi:flagellar biosynthesis/type III secretory pathway protein FliH